MILCIFLILKNVKNILRRKKRLINTLEAHRVVKDSNWNGKIAQFINLFE